ncbi:MAG: carboxymuconolactone decarboxylase family protein [Nitrospinota bacterium]
MSEARIERGRVIREAGFGPEGEGRWQQLYAADPGHANSILEYCFGTVWDRPGLDMKVRELIVIAAAAAQDLPGEVDIHTRGALNRGATRQEITETIVQCAPYIGFPKTNHALLAAKRVFDNWDQRKDWHAG